MNMKSAFRPIWEMELVISGAVIIGLFQLPQLADHAFNGVLPHLSKQSMVIMFLLYYVAKLSINSLIGAFLLHFIVRSLWVATIGLSEVFPENINLDKTNFGPVTKELIQSKGISLSGLQIKLDRFASMIFSILFLIIGMLIVISIYNSIAIATAFALKKGGMVSPFLNLYKSSIAGVYGIPILISLLGAGMDKWLGKDLSRLDRYPGIVKVTRLFNQINYYLFLEFITGPVVLAFRSRISAIRFTLIGFSIFSILFLSFVFNLEMRDMHFDSYVFMPVESAPQRLDTACYDSLRTTNDPVEMPSIQSDIIDGNAEPIRLFLPFRVMYNNELIEQLCPDLKPFHNDGFYEFSFVKKNPGPGHTEKVEQALECTKKLFQIELDGQTVDDHGMLFTRHQITRKGGLLLYIPTANLESGQHTLKIQLKRKSKKKTEDFQYFIPFWLMKTLPELQQNTPDSPEPIQMK